MITANANFWVFFVSKQMGYTTTTQSAISEDLNLSVAEFAPFGSILTIDGMIGAIASGRIADHFGRKGALGMSTFSSIVGWIAIYFSKGCVSLDIGMFLNGYGIGVFSYVVPIYIAEITPKNLRGGLAALNQMDFGDMEMEAAMEKKTVGKRASK
ncbi:hypothetical protein Ancab_019380, partial [Ancistrocladus abbreviatus]